MSEPFIAEIRIFAGNFAPRGWAFCDGQLLPIANNTALFSLIGTTYGGDGRTTTALPDLRGRATMHPGRGPGLTSRRLGQRTGSPLAGLTEAQMPAHSHAVLSAAAQADSKIPGPTKAVAKTRNIDRIYQTGTAADLVEFSVSAVGSGGGSQAHDNVQPFLALNFIIALQGLYPSRG